MVQLFFLYFGLPKIGIRLDGSTCARIGLAFLGGSYMAEAFRSGLDSVEPIQKEAALSLGFSGLQTLLLPISLAGRWLERRLRRGEFGDSRTVHGE